MGAVNNLAPSDGTGATAGAFALDFTDGNMAALSGASNVTPSATPSAATSFQTTLPLATIAAAKFIVLYGALPGEPTQNWLTPDSATHAIPAWYWQDTERKMQAVLLEWAADYRSRDVAGRFFNSSNGAVTQSVCGSSSAPSGIPYTDGSGNLRNYDTTLNYGFSRATIRDICKSFNPCAPWLFVFSSCVSDTPAAGAGQRFDLTDFVCDENCGSLQQLCVNQVMIDNFYEQAWACNFTTHVPEAVAPACLNYFEARAVQPGSTGSTTPPDNGAGAGQNETPPILAATDYTLYSALHLPGSQPGVAETPQPGAQTTFDFVPDGIWTPC
jgi:hypothetical protein